MLRVVVIVFWCVTTVATIACRSHSTVDTCFRIPTMRREQIINENSQSPFGRDYDGFWQWSDGKNTSQPNRNEHLFSCVDYSNWFLFVSSLIPLSFAAESQAWLFFDRDRPPFDLSIWHQFKWFPETQANTFTCRTCMIQPAEDLRHRWSLNLIFNSLLVWVK